MDERAPRPTAKGDLVRAYKQLLQEALDRRPSGTRLKIASALGKHKSFVSQITSQACPAPVLARDLATIFEICHFTAEERAAFMAAYRAAHPGRSQAAGRDVAGEPEHMVQARLRRSAPPARARGDHPADREPHHRAGGPARVSSNVSGRREDG